MGLVTLTIFRRYFVIQMRTLNLLYPCTKCDDSSFSRSRDIIGVKKIKMHHMTLTMSILGTTCHPWAKT